MLNPNASPFTLTMHERCPKLLEFVKIIQPPIKKRKYDALHFGNVIHEVLENFYGEINEELADINPKQHFLDILNILLTTHWNYTLPESRNKDAQKIINIFATNQAEKYNTLKKNGNIKNFYPIMVEERIISKKYELEVVVDRRNNNWSLVDYKTTKEFPELLLCDRLKLNNEQQIKYDKKMKPYLIQAVLNALAIEDKYNVLPQIMIFAFVRHLNNTKHHGLLPIMINENTINYVKLILQNYKENVKNNNFPMTTDKDNCNQYNGCEYRVYCDASKICWVSL